MNQKEQIMKQLYEEMDMFNHSISSYVRFAEVDSFGVTHNIQYLYWLEWARVEYLKNLGVKLTAKTFLTEFPLMVVHTEIDYYNPLLFNDKYYILTRIKYIKNTSICFENVIHNIDKTINAKASAILVHLDAKTKRPVDIPQYHIDRIIKYEKENSVLLI